MASCRRTRTVTLAHLSTRDLMISAHFAFGALGRKLLRTSMNVIENDEPMAQLSVCSKLNVRPTFIHCAARVRAQPRRRGSSGSSLSQARALRYGWASPCQRCNEFGYASKSLIDGALAQRRPLLQLGQDRPLVELDADLGDALGADQLRCAVARALQALYSST